MRTTPSSKNLTAGARTWFQSLLAASAMLLGLTVMPGVASATTLHGNTASTSPCNVSISGGGVVLTTGAGTLIYGVTAGKSVLTLDCNQSSGAAFAVEASLLAVVGTTNVLQANEVDIPGASTFALSASDTGCPSATAGQCLISTFPVPASFSASDTNAQCEPSPAQLNAGLFGCSIAVATAQQSPVPGAAFLLTYAGQAQPAAPTIAAMQSTGSPGSLVNIADATGATGLWWGNSLAYVQGALAGVAPGVPPSTCGTGGGYGNVPATFLTTRWFAANTTTPLVSTASNVTISNVCYDNKTLSTPSLGGTIAVPATATPGSYTVYLCELNTTPFPSNDANAAANCGTLPAGESWIDASFTFTVAPNLVTQNLPVASSVSAASWASFSDQLATSGTTNAVTFTQSTGAPSLVVSSSGLVSTSGPLAGGTYTATGTTSDANGASGSFSFTLSVASAPVIAPRATSVSGLALPGKRTTLIIHGQHFTAHPSVKGPAGSKIIVLRSNASSITIAVTVAASAKKGSSLLTVHFSSGKSTKVKFTIK